MGYQCDSGDGNAATILIQQLTGEVDTLAWCETCWPAFVASTFGHLFNIDDPISLIPAARTDDERHPDDEAAIGEGSSLPPDGPGSPGSSDPTGGDDENTSGAPDLPAGDSADVPHVGGLTVPGSARH